jgi:hypothetical protein
MDAARERCDKSEISDGVGKGGGSGGDEGGDFIDLVDALPSATSGVGGGGFRGGGIMGGGKSAAVGEALEGGGKPAEANSSRRCSTGLASSYKANP